MSRPEDVNELLKWREARPNRYKLRDKIESREDFRAKYSKALEAKGLKNDKNISQEISKRRLNLKLDDQLKYDKQESQAGKTLLELTREKQYLSQQHGNTCEAQNQFAKTDKIWDFSKILVPEPDFL